MTFSTRGRLHARLSTFVEWIATENAVDEEIGAQANDIRSRIRAKAFEDKLTIRATPSSGSSAKRTGLRRHLLGGAEVEGQDVDVPFVVAPKTKEDEDVDRLVERFKKYAEACYPKTEIEPSKCSVKLHFSRGLAFDLVPALATDVEDEQLLFRTNEAPRRTSFQKHVEFVRSRTKKSNDLPGRVKFNECVRLFKWWREFQESSAGSLKNLPSFTVELLCAKAFDTESVSETYAQTLSRWFGYLAHVVGDRTAITFNDFGRAPQANAGQSGWLIADPVNAANNVAAALDNRKVQDLLGWLTTSRDALTRAVAADARGDHGVSLEALVPIFGSPIRRHSGE